MKKGIIFTLGAMLGAGVGSTITYFIVRNIEAARADEAIDRYAEYSDERVQRAIDKLKDSDIGELDKEEEKPDTEDDKIKKNEGVKKYHHQNGLESAYGANNIFSKKQSKEEKREVIKEISNVIESKLIDEITENEFSDNDNGYDKQVVDVCLGDDKDIVGIWGYQTDNEEFVEKKFGKSIEELLNYRPYEELLEYTANNDAIGSLYLRNGEMMIDFEFVIRDYREDDK